MSKTAVKKEKKKWSTGKKVAVILCSVLLALILIVVSGGLIYLHNYCQVKDYTVTAMGNHDVTLIAHRGFRAVAPENTLPAFEEAGKAGFTGAECDTYRTKDGVWVISHDSHTYRMMDQHAFVEKKTYDELLTYNTDNGVNIDQYPNLKICTLEDYLKTCVQYNMTAVIELKGKNNTEHYDEIMKLVADTGAKPLFISFHLENLQQIRKLSQDVPVWYLVQKIDDQAIADAKALGGECGIDFNGNKDENTKEVVQKCLDAGLEVGAWTIDDMDTLQSLKDKGIVNAEVYLSQNDGTLMTLDNARRYPILTIACGPTNSIRGASYLTCRDDAIVIDVGGTTSDFGVLSHGFPRESGVAVDIGGVRTNFRMPDVISIGLGGGSIVREHDAGTVTVGPDSVGYHNNSEYSELAEQPSEAESSVLYCPRIS